MTKLISVDIETSGVKADEVVEWANEMAHVYADIEVSDVRVSGNKITCKVGFSGMDDTQPDDVKMKVEEYLVMNEAFSVTKISCY
ncbi:MAG: hypothetical protein FJ354_02725 [Thaumarchaeota archaeon]|nr:hypothetical protein [Nitrososphaerota archaeon]